MDEEKEALRDSRVHRTEKHDAVATFQDPFCRRLMSAKDEIDS